MLRNFRIQGRSLWYGSDARIGGLTDCRAGGSVFHRSISYVARGLIIALALLVLGGGTPASAHPELARAIPAPDALLAAPTQTIEIWFSERVDVGAGSPQIELVSETGQRLMTNARVDPADPKHVIAEIDGLDFGTWTVAWQVRSLDDGHTLTGSYAFRIGGANRAPGAATTEGERPQVWNVVTRWATFLGAALTVSAAGFLLLADGRILARASIPVPKTVRPLALAGAGLGLMASLAEPFFLTQFPPANSLAPSLGDAIDIQPGGWALRVIALFTAALFATVAVLIPQKWTHSMTAGLAGLCGLLGLSMTGHAAARDTLRTVAIAVDFVHQGAIALWIGMLLIIALSWREIGQEAVSRFSTAALPLIVIGILAGMLNSAFILPELSALWRSDYGRVIIFKILVLGGVLLLAMFNRSTVMAMAKAGATQLQRLRIPIQAESLLALVIVLGGSTLSLLATPTVAETSSISSIAITHYSAPAPRDERLLVTLRVDPAKPGFNTIGITVKDLDGNPVPNEEIQRVIVDFSSLTNQTSQPDMEAVPGEDGVWQVTGSQLSIADWWRIMVHVRRAGVNDAITEFFMILPDPNVTGFPDAIDGDDDPAARAVFDQGLTSLTSLHRVTYSQQVASGSDGQVVLALARVNDGFDGSTPAASISTEQTTSITIGTTRWLSQTSSDRWGATRSNPPIPPFEWGEEYVAATGFRLGGIEEVNGEPAQIVTFYSPQTNLAPAYYAWWVSVETGELLKIAMVSRVHYMTQVFADFDGNVVIEPPVNPEGTPVATPGVDLSTIGS
jgi:copper transport protein